jgi:hypothetical protein
MFNNIFSDDRAIYEITWEIMVLLDRPQMTTQHGTCALHAGELRLQIRTQKRRPENWPISRDKLCTKYYKNFKEFTQNIELDKV